MISLFESLPAGILWILALGFVAGSFLVIWKDRLSTFLHRRQKEGSSLESVLINVIRQSAKVFALFFYLFLFGFPILFLILSVLPTIRVTREHGLTAQDLLVYGQRRDAVKLVVPPIDTRLPLASPDQVKADAEKLRSIFSDKDWISVQTWAHLMAGEKYTTGNRRFTDDEAAHIAWRYLSRSPGAKESDLLQLEAVIARAIPDERTRRRLLEWGRMHNRYLDKSADLLLFTRLPLKVDWFAWWTVYTEYCPTDDVLAARKQFLIERLGDRRFHRDVWTALQDWGKEVYEKEPGLAEQLPPGERAYIIAAIDRMVGLDAAGRKVYELDRDNKVPLGKDYTVLFLLLHVFYPNDDLTYMQFGTGWYGEHSLFATAARGFSAALLVASLFLVFWALLVQRSLRRLTIHYLGRALRLQGKPAYEHLEMSFNPWLQLVALGVVIPIAWLFARLFMEDFYVLYFRSEIGLLLAVVYGALIGGALVEAIENLIALGCIRCGLDPERMIVDNVLAAGLSIGLLWFFQNSWFATASGLALGLFTSIALKLVLRRKPAEAAVPIRTTVDPAGPPRRKVEETSKGKAPPVRRVVLSEEARDAPPPRPVKPARRTPEQDNTAPVRRKRPPQDKGD
jgi:hypothetical protein